MLQVSCQVVCLVRHQHHNVASPEESSEQGPVHVPVVAVVDQSSVGVLDHYESKVVSSKQLVSSYNHG